MGLTLRLQTKRYDVMIMVYRVRVWMAPPPVTWLNCLCTGRRYIQGSRRVGQSGFHPFQTIVFIFTKLHFSVIRDFFLVLTIDTLTFYFWLWVERLQWSGLALRSPGCEDPRVGPLRRGFQDGDLYEAQSGGCPNNRWREFGATACNHCTMVGDIKYPSI